MIKQQSVLTNVDLNENKHTCINYIYIIGQKYTRDIVHSRLM